MSKNIDYQNRLNQIILSDNKESSFGIDKLIKSELINVLKNYFYVSNDDVEVKYEFNGNEGYVLSVIANTKGIKKLKKLM